MEMNFCRFTLLTSYQQREKNKLFSYVFESMKNVQQLLMVKHILKPGQSFFCRVTLKTKQILA